MSIPSKAARFSIVIAIIAGGSFRSVAQSLSDKSPILQFEVASIRPGKPDDKVSMSFPMDIGSAYNANGGMFSATNLPLIVYIGFAYSIPNDRMRLLAQQLPEWALSEGFDLQARSGNTSPTKNQMRQMMQSLLADRFNLKVHTEMQQVAVLTLIPVKTGGLGPRIRIHREDGTPCPATPPAAGLSVDVLPNGFPITCGTLSTMKPTVPGRLHVGARNVPIGLIASSVSGMGILDHPVLDQTNLPGLYDFSLEFTPDMPGGVVSNDLQPDPSGTPFLTALKDQLGLKLISQKASIDSMIVDHVERPSPN